MPFRFRAEFMRATAVAAIAGLAACSADLPTRTIAPQGLPASDVDATPSTDNVLSATVAFTAAGADSARVLYVNGADSSGTTPFSAVRSGLNCITLLGLKAGTTYSYVVQTMAQGVRASSPILSFTTGQLPAALANVKLKTISGKTSRYAATGVGTSAGGYAVIFDSTGSIAWYHDFTSAKLNVTNVVMQPNGNITAFVGNTSGWQALDGRFVEVTADGREVHTYRAPPGTYIDEHEILLTGSGSATKAHFFTFTQRVQDLTMLGMGSAVKNAGHQLIRENAWGEVEFTWDAWDHVSVDEWVGDEAAKKTRGGETDYDHPNALTFDAAGNYIVSWRNLDQVMAIDPTTGEVLWRIGGKEGDHTFAGDPMGGFSKQHAVKILPNGNMLLFDNGTDHDPAITRAVEYKVDHESKTATLVWEYKHAASLYAAYVGWVQRLSSGTTWVCFGMFSRTVEVTANDEVVWESVLSVNGATPVSYRIVPIRSLYAYEAP